MPHDRRSGKSVRVLLAEDQGMSGPLALLLGMEEDMDVVAQVAAGDAVVDSALVTRPDVAVLDVELPGLSGLDAAALLRDEVPGCRVLVMTTFARPGALRRALEAGAAGFLVKDAPVAELADAIRRVLRGETVVDPALAAAEAGTTGGSGPPGASGTTGASGASGAPRAVGASGATRAVGASGAADALGAEPSPPTPRERDVRGRT
ncbi:response regulator [Streptomyces wuyuanensis]|uniref:response regulator n=1 Tax=Streptomyces wuyuanensis TaxID=1196353 RepID=UPI00382A2546